MPEGDTVYLTAKNLNEALAGRMLESCDIRVPAFATVDLSGNTIDSVVPRGKHLLARIGDHSIHTHLKMEGAWHLYSHGTKWKRPAYQARVILGTEERLAVGFELGLVEVIRRDEEEAALAFLGPDLLGGDWDAEEALRRVLERPDRPVFYALLDQRNLAGLGNEYVNEICFLRGILPTTPVTEVRQPEQLIDLSYRLIHANKDRTERITTGRMRGAKAWVYGRTGRPCLRCGTPIRSADFESPGEHPRRSHWCPNCQR
ncbi:Fpg/Nei family DNA glycosylase [Salinibacterium sp. dk2585]|uniref:DNA-formamidopyrimidine glycosylase family protein n=1 Tax=unclassified Salinibacterium TaxID=2632331 RepID=UPI0011C24ECA|nr:MULTISPECIES: DNA-formamidopyrimidine glycosylase family protein [unclassified Salinibacterium]QEE60585.1 Fpg/Nei family DNA glycosylase [Salinibacterium sp. dk2585]TXK55657.1 Fpg/Nei family DNA glycosylase [Salinibacterium sp. dk5596]